MGGVLEDVVLLVGLSGLHGLDLLSDAKHSLAEAVELLLRLRLRWLNHERTGDRPAHGGGVEAVVLKTLGDVGFRHTRHRLEGTDVSDELVSAETVLVCVQNLVVILEASGHVVGVEDGDLGGLGEPRTTHHADVHPADGENGGRAPGGSSHGTHLAAAVDDGMVGEERGEVGGDADGADAGTTATVGDAEGLVEVEMAHVCADVTRRGEANLSVHVGAVHVDLAAVVVDDLTHLLDGELKAAVGGGVGDHEAAQVVLVLLSRLSELGDVDVALVVARHTHHLEATHGGRSRVGSVGRHGDDAHVAVALPDALLVRLDRAETRVLARSARVGLHGGGGEAGDLGQPVAELLDHDGVALGLVLGAEGVQLAELGPGDGDHFGGGVELHGA
mmetsp:Transcript_20222/g.43799  ORF Transcript_20222/g.43799 Transcript_20222/m.43799 type:complete len:389 (-) Transcript_20222:246-1412(-)